MSGGAPAAGGRRAAETAVLWETFSGRLRSFIAARVSDPQAADDVLQDVFEKIHRRSGPVREPDRVTSWIFQVTRNAIVDHYRSAPRRRERPTGQLSAAPEEADGVDVLLDATEAVRREMSACVAPLLEQLAPRYREAVELVDLAGLTQTQAADHVGISVSGMKSRVQRARAELRRTLDDWCDVAVDARGGPLRCVPEQGSGCGGVAGS